MRLRIEKEIYELKDGMRIGRAEDNEIQTPVINKRVTRHHAIFLYRDEKFVIMDLDSSLGTYINEQRANPGIGAEIKVDDKIRFGAPPDCVEAYVLA